MLEWHFVVLGAVGGLAVGATGVGGGSLMTPALIGLFGVSPATAVGTDLLYSVLSKGQAAALLGHGGMIDWRLVTWLGLGSVPAVIATTALTTGFMTSSTRDLLVELLVPTAIVVTGACMLLHELPVHALTGRLAVGHVRTGCPVVATVFAGALVGALVSASSVGAGAIGIAALTTLYPTRPVARLVGSDLAHAVLVSVVAGLAHAVAHQVDYAMLASLLFGSAPAVWLGTRLAKHLHDTAMKRVIAIVMVLVGVTTFLRVQTV